MDGYPQTAARRAAASRECSRLLSIFDAVDRDAAAATAISAALESNHIVCFPRAPLRLPDRAELQYLSRELPSRLRLKNASYHPAARQLTGLEADAALSERTAALLREHLDAVTAFLRRVMPHLCVGWTVGKCSFRPIEERGRNLRPHASNELVHVDAGAYGATNGDRVLRFFVNVNEHADRVWASKGSIQDVLERHGTAAGLLDAAGNLQLRIHKNAADHAFSFLIRGLAQFNDLARVLDSSPYDRAMRQLHNYMKDSDAFRSDMHGYEEIRFPPGAAWMVFTDGVSHACLSGQFALVTTIIVRREAMRYPQFAPYNLLAAHAASRSMTSSG
jgi:3-deoxy-D-manno-oct-2-ulosonic acid (Kdo) hydroxylase